MTFKRRHLVNAARINPDGVRRLAAFLRLRDTERMSDAQVARLIYWRLTRREAWRKRRLEALD